MDHGTFYYDTEGNRLGSDDFLLPITLYDGMKMTFHGYDGAVFKVVEWSYHKGHADEDPGLKVILQSIA